MKIAAADIAPILPKMLNIIMKNKIIFSLQI